MAQINRYRLCGTVMVDVYIDIDAPTLEDAIEYAENNVAIEEYANGTIGVEDGGYNFGDGEITCCDYIIFELCYKGVIWAILLPHFPTFRLYN